MRFIEFLTENVATFNVVHTTTETEEGDPENYEPDVSTAYFNIEDEQGNTVGELTMDDYFGYIRGHLYNKFFPNLDDYGNEPQEALDKFLQTKTGQRWWANIEKYKPLSGPTNDYRIKR